MLAYALLAESTVIAVKELQPSKALGPMSVTPAGIITLVRLLHPPNAKLSMVVRLCGKKTLVRLLQRRNDESLIVVMPAGIITLVTAVHSEKAQPAMLITPSGITTAPAFASGHLISDDKRKSYSSPSVLAYAPLAGSTMMADKELQW